ncbi:MAG: UDP-N-acetylglucosamine 2-epimerase (non-hydrolyzing) [candidate division Zixibacteria bacterium]|nr:UDP-N-acetylglucosamine 2-epimerase (non-hydrolyzing) [candidate division Zixibacteria bacterium]
MSASGTGATASRGRSRAAGRSGRRRSSRPLVVSAFGTRPQLIKLSTLWELLEGSFRSVLIDSGQHYDYEMAGTFYSGGGLRKPDVHLGIKRDTAAGQVAGIADALDRAFKKLRPDALITFGDTSTTAGAALAGAYHNIPVAHVEAGLRSFSLDSAEEKNRIVADHLATWRFCPTSTSITNLRREGLTVGNYGVGDVLYESFCRMGANRMDTELLAHFGVTPGEYYFVTSHRAETVDDPIRLKRLVGIVKSLDRRTIFAVHPRTRKNLIANRLWSSLSRHSRLVLTKPLDHARTLTLVRNARAVLTDSGGVQREACWARTPCLTLRDRTEWIETVTCGANRIVDLDQDGVRVALRRPFRIKPAPDRYFRMRDPSRRIVERLRADLS